MAVINVALTDTFDQWRTKTNTLGTNQGDLANLDAGFAGSDLVSCLNELRSGEDLTQLILGDSSGVGNNRIKLGDSADLQIYHSGSNSHIDDLGTGDLRMSSNGTGIILSKGGSETMAKFLTDGAVELYNNNNLRLTTTTGGVDIAGSIAVSASVTLGDTFVMPDVTAGKILIADNTSYQEQAVSGDATLASSGALTIANDAVNAAKIAAGAVGASEIADGSITSTEFSSAVTLNIKNSSGTVLKTLRSPGS